MKFQTLKRKDDFLKLIKEEPYRRDKDLTIYLIKNPENECKLRIGFIISKKTGGAVLRNKIKRVIKETLRASSKEVCCGLDILFKINKNICDIDLKELKTKLNNYIDSNLTSRL